MVIRISTNEEPVSYYPQKGCQLNDNWIYLALLDLNERIKKLEKKDYDRKNKKIRNKN
jgi:hypothetical protein